VLIRFSLIRENISEVTEFNGYQFVQGYKSNHHNEVGKVQGGLDLGAVRVVRHLLSPPLSDREAPVDGG
jgi:hypothetical protein